MRVRSFLGIVACWGLIGCGLMETKSEADKQRALERASLKAAATSAAKARAMPARNPLVMARLKTLENRVVSAKELEQYSKALPYMKSDEERIRFLELGGFEERQEWLRAQDFPSRPTDTQAQMKELVDAQDIALGMPQTLVRRSWGEPESVEVSGNPQFRNERWRYNTYVSTVDGYRIEKKIVYFEAGKVVGWEVE